VTRPKLLLADDSVTIRKVVELTFADEGIDVTTVADGETAMMKFIEIQPDVVLVDVGLPGTNGYKICEMIKLDETTAHIPVLLLVGSFEPFDHDEAEKAGADGFLTKPFHSIRDLVARVNDLLGNVQTPPEKPENEDIQQLYKRSFAETVPIENYETVPAFAADDAFTEPVPESHETNNNADVATSDWLDDELIETVNSGPTTETSEELAVPEAATQETEAEMNVPVETAPAAEISVEIDTEPIKEFDWSPAAIVSATDDAGIGAAAGFSASFVPEEQFISPPPGSTSDHITEELHDLSTDEMPELAPVAEELETDEGTIATSSATDGSEPSREFVDILVRRVVERLSDRVIREIAQEAVPRIAEKLMREALEEEGKR
jgi:CheY-like chemotaxis protein